MNTQKIDTNSSYKSGESAPEPPSNDSADKLQKPVTGGLARVTSYNQLERSHEGEGDESERDPSHLKEEDIDQLSKGRTGPAILQVDDADADKIDSGIEDARNQDLKANYNVI